MADDWEGLFDNLDISADDGLTSDPQDEDVNVKEAILFVIDCHASLYAKTSMERDPMNPYGEKVEYSQLVTLIRAAVSFLKAQIIAKPNSYYGVVFFNTAKSDGTHDGIYVVKHKTGNALHTPNVDYLKQLGALQDIPQFQQQIGVCPYLEGSTSFSDVLWAVQKQFAELSATLSTSTSRLQLDSSVFLFTANSNPTMVPFEIGCHRARGEDLNATIKLRGKSQRLADVKAQCTYDQQTSIARVSSMLNINFRLFPMSTALPLSRHHRQLAAAMASSSQAQSQSVSGDSHSAAASGRGEDDEIVNLNAQGLFPPLTSHYPDDHAWLSLSLSPITSDIQNQDSQMATTTSSSSSLLTSLSGSRAGGSNLAPSSRHPHDYFNPDFFVKLFGDQIIDDIRQKSANMSELFHNVRQKTYSRRPLRSLPIIIQLPRQQQSQGDSSSPAPPPHVVIGVDVYAPFIITKETSTSDVRIHSTTNNTVKAKSRFISQTGAELVDEDITTYIKCGGNEPVFLTQNDMKKVKDFGPAGITILGFKPYDEAVRVFNPVLPVHNNVRPPYFLYPSEYKYPGSTDAFSDFMSALYVTKRCAFARFIPKRGAPPRLVALLPQLETLHGATGEILRPAGINMIVLPFAEELRDLQITSYVEPEDDVMTAARDVVDALSHKSLRSKQLLKNTDFNIYFDCPNNRRIQLRMAILESLALGRPRPELVDRLRLAPNMHHVETPVKEFINRITAIVGPFGGGPKPRGRATATKRVKPEPAAASGDGSSSTTSAADDITSDDSVKELNSKGSLKTLKVDQLKTYLRRHEQPVSGKKDDLIARIQAYLQP